ncbi:MAG: BTAD domain-containing putative transcriptional regulator [Bacteroidota bacterium]
MLAPHVIFIGSDIYLEQLLHQIDVGIGISSHKTSYRLKRKDVRRKTVFISTLNKGDCQHLARIRQDFPTLPILVLIKEPSQQDLIQLIKLKVDEVVTLPVTSEVLNQTIYKLGDLTERLSWITKMGQLSRQLKAYFRLFQRVIQQTSAPLREINSNAIDVLGISPFSSLNLHFQKDLEEDNVNCDVQVTFFGEHKISIRGEQLPPIKGKKNNSILAYLLYHYQKPIHKEILMEQFWPNTPAASAKNSLNVAIYTIRKHFDAYFEDFNLILLEKENYYINSELDIRSDVEQFLKFWEKGRSIEMTEGAEIAYGAYNKALSYYRSEFLADFRYDEWCESERDNLKESYLVILNSLNTIFFDRAEFDACIKICKKMLEKDPYLEDVHRRLMECYDQMGLRDLAKNQYTKYEKNLQEEFEIRPSRTTQELYVRICEG